MPADAGPQQTGAGMFGLMQGFIVQRLLVGGTDGGSYLAGVRYREALRAVLHAASDPDLGFAVPFRR